MIIAELTITPLGEGTSVSKFVKEAFKAISSTGLKIELTPMSTVVEANNIDEIFRAAKLGEEAMLKLGAKRVIIDIKIDHRLDKNATMETKKRAVMEE